MPPFSPLSIMLSPCSTPFFSSPTMKGRERREGGGGGRGGRLGKGGGGRLGKGVQEKGKRGKTNLARAWEQRKKG